MRVALMTLFAMSLACCSPSTGVDERVSSDNQVGFDNSDDRFDLMAYHMPALEINEARECVKIIKSSAPFKHLVRGAKREGFEMGVVFWSEVEARFLSTTSETVGVLVEGRIVQDGELKPMSLFADATTRNEKAEKCGEYGGEVIVKIGYLALNDSIKLAEEASPGIFESMGYNYDDLLEGVRVINAQASSIKSISNSEKISCVAVFQAMSHADSDFEPYSNIWVAALSQDVKAKKIIAKDIAEQSKFWRAYKLGGSQGIAQVDGYTELALRCEETLNEAIEAQAEVLK